MKVRKSFVRDLFDLRTIGYIFEGHEYKAAAPAEISADDYSAFEYLLGGFLIGVFSFSDYCALYASAISAASLEYKDKAYGGKWDWIDFGLTVAGACVGRLIFRWWL